MGALSRSQGVYYNAPPRPLSVDVIIQLIMAHPVAVTQHHDPFDLSLAEDYAAWRTAKLARYPNTISDLVVPIGNPARLTVSERNAIIAMTHHANMAVYACADPAQVGKTDIAELGRQLGLSRLDQNLCADNDSISSITQMNAGRASHYIPYTNSPLNWHTDGYYNSGKYLIRAFLLHCVRPAADGGENQLLDPEIAYILLRDTDPDALAALMHPQAMTIPANEEQGQKIRGARSGPVFAVDPQTGCLHMRYTARTRSIIWRNDADTLRGQSLLRQILNDRQDYRFDLRLEAGQGLVCNNILHNRARYGDDGPQQRLMFRARYYDRIADK